MKALNHLMLLLWLNAASTLTASEAELKAVLASQAALIGSLKADIEALKSRLDSVQTNTTEALSRSASSQALANEGLKNALDAQKLVSSIGTQFQATSTAIGGLVLTNDLLIVPLRSGVIHISSGGICYYENAGRGAKWCK